jgi:hypothetical protein
MLSIMDLPKLYAPLAACARCGCPAKDHHVGDVCVAREHRTAVSLPWALRSVQLSGALIERRQNARRLAWPGKVAD